MRTKSILLGAAVLAAGVASSMASNVYSVNVVGYVTLNLTNGFNLISNPLDAVGGGTATGNTIATALPSMPNDTTVYKFANGSFGTSDAFLTGIGWVAGGSITLNPGEGLFVQIPTVANGGPVGGTNITFAGTVCQGPLTNSVIQTGYNVIAAQAPVTGLLSTTLGYPPQNDDTLYVFDPVSQGYPNSFAYLTGVGWIPNEPTINVGQAMFLQNNSGNQEVWTNSFKVQ